MDRPDSAPTVHGVYDYWLGGRQHLRADRELAEAIGTHFPSVPEHMTAAKDFHLRTARWSREQGITRILRAGAVTWQPDGRNIHEVVPDAQVVYVNGSEGADDWAQAMLASRPGVAAVHARVRRPAEVLKAPEVAALLAPQQPVTLIIGMVLHFMPPETAAGTVAAYAKALPRGSFAALSVALPDCSRQAGELLAMFTPATVYRHTLADVESWIGKAELETVPPGIADVRFVPGRPVPAGEPFSRPPGVTVGIVGRKP